MRNPERIPAILDKIKTIWQRQPDMRLHQLIHNLQWDYFNDTKDGLLFKFPYTYSDGYVVNKSHVDLYNVEDDRFEKWLDYYIERMDK